MTIVRRAYVCLKCKPPQRIFLPPGETKVPACKTHGRMEKQANRPYMKGKLARDR